MKLDTKDFRYFLKEFVRLEIDFRSTDQSMRVPPPPIQKPFEPDAKRIDLVAPGEWEGIEPLSVEDSCSTWHPSEGSRTSPGARHCVTPWWSSQNPPGCARCIARFVRACEPPRLGRGSSPGFAGGS